MWHVTLPNCFPRFCPDRNFFFQIFLFRLAFNIKDVLCVTYPSDVQAGVDANPHTVFLSFFLEDKTSAPDVFSICSFIPCAHFESSSVMVSCYGCGI